jgi:hypothetical protein
MSCPGMGIGSIDRDAGAAAGTGRMADQRRDE